MNTLTLPVPDWPTVRNALLKTAGVLLVVYLCYVVRQIWLPLILAFLLAMVLDPIVDRMEHRGWSRTSASAFIFASFLLISTGLAVLFFPVLANEFSVLQRGFERYFPDSSHTGLLASFHRMGLSPAVAKVSAAGIEDLRASAQHSSSALTDFGMSIAMNAIWIVIVPIVAFYALRDFHVILAKSLLLVPAKRRDLVATAVTEITGIFARFLRGLLMVSAFNGAATAVLLSVLRVPGAITLGVVAGILYSVPYIGALLTLVITAAVAFVGGGPNMLFLSVGLSIVLHQIIFDQIVSPRVLGNQVGLHPILSILALLVGNLLLGIIGMILAVPVAACIQIAVLATIPKLSREIVSPSHDVVDTVNSLIQETEEEHLGVDSDPHIHPAVSSAVAAIVAASSASNEAPSGMEHKG